MSADPAQKVNKEATPEPPRKPKQETPKKVSPSKKPKEPTQYSNVDKEAGCAIPVDIRYEGTAAQAKPGKKGGFEQTLKLSASDAFSISKTVSIHLPTCTQCKSLTFSYSSSSLMAMSTLAIKPFSYTRPSRSPSSSYQRRPRTASTSFTSHPRASSASPSAWTASAQAKTSSADRTPTA